MQTPSVSSDEPRVPLSKGVRKWNLFLMAMSVVLITLDSTIANVALPHIQGTMSTTLDELAWVLTSYILGNAILMPLSAFLCSRYGTRRVLIPSIIAFTVSSALCGIAQSLEELVLFRFIQGATGAFIMPAGQSLLLDIYTRKEYPKALSLWATGTMIGPILGPTLGGYLTEFLSWRWVFLINLPIGALAAFGMYMVVPKTPLAPERRMDFTGFLLFSLAIASAQMMFDRGEGRSWFHSWEIIIELTLAIVFFLLFLLHIVNRKSPYVRLECFRDRNFSIGCLLLFVTCVALFGSMALMPSYLQNLLSFPVFISGLVIAPRGFGSFVGMSLYGRFGQRYDARVFIAFGFGLMIIAMALMSNFSLQTDIDYIVLTGLLHGVSISLVFLPTNIVMFSSLSPALTPDAVAIAGLTRNLAGSFGISMLFSMLTRNTQVYHAYLVESVTAFRQMPLLPAAWDWTSEQGAMLLNAEITRQAAMQSFVYNFAALKWMGMAAVCLVVFVRLRPVTDVPAVRQSAQTPAGAMD